VWERPRQLQAADDPLHTDPKTVAELLDRERKQHAVDEPSCPREIDSHDVPKLVARIRLEKAQVQEKFGTEKEGSSQKLIKGANGGDDIKVIFILPDDDTALITRCVQEDQILNTKLKLKQKWNNEVVDLPSFWEVWRREDGKLKVRCGVVVLLC